jgi:hypothetical protein
MADTTTVPVPASAVADPVPTTVPVPQGAIADTTGQTPGAGQITGIGANTGTRSDDTLGRAMDTGMDYLGGAVAGAGKNLLKGVGGVTELAGEAINRIPGVGETLAPRAGLDAEKKGLKSATASSGLPGETAGGIAEEGAEWMGGDAALKALGKLGKIYKFAPDLLKLIDKYPKVAQVLLGSIKGAGIGGAQAGVKAAGEGKPLKEVKEAAVGGAEGGAAGGLAGEALDAATTSKAARSAVNRSMGATARDVTYGNPAKALLDEGIKNPVTGNIEEYKSALRAGKSPAEAEQAAGGRIAAVSEKINEYKPQLDAALEASKAKISVKDAIIDPIYEAASDIIKNRAMTESERNVAIDKLLELQKSLTEGLGKQISPAEANDIKLQIGDRINWGGTTAVTDEVKPVYKKLYGSLKSGVHTAVPEAAQLNEKMTNLMSAHDVLLGLYKKEEVGGGPSLGGYKGVGAWLEAQLGKIIPTVAAVSKSPVTKAGAGLIGEKMAGHVRFQDSEGNIHDVPEAGLEKARGIDPGLKVIN